MANSYGTVEATPCDSRQQQRAIALSRRAALLLAACGLALLCMCAMLITREDGQMDELLGTGRPMFVAIDPARRGQLFQGNALAFVDEGGNSIAYSPWAANGEMRRERQTEVGQPGWEPGPDYYSTVKWDNAPIYPSTARKVFDPYVGHEGCSTCNKTMTGSFVLSVTERCDSSSTTGNVKRILRPRLSNPFESTVWANTRFEEWNWADEQLSFLLNFYTDLTLVIPPCFIPRYLFSWRSLGLMNEAIYQRGLTVLIVGGLSGVDFLSRFLAGNDGYGYLDAESGDMVGASATSALDRVWSEGPFYLQNDASSTEFLYGPKMLRSVGRSVVGIPATELPPSTKHYYMSDEETSVVFEVPSGQGRVIFVGFDYSQIVPGWADVLLLAERELQLRVVEEKEEEEPLKRDYPEPYNTNPPAPAAAEPGEAQEEVFENDIRENVNFYCGKWMLFKDSRNLEKCRGQDCNNNRIPDMGGGDDIEFCKWMNPHGFCYTLDAHEYCDEFPTDTRQCFNTESNPPAYAYDNDCSSYM
mmetsp:Transcript_16061/g.32123  ORF Transcript_16061/g.32123 Transcript_16061/m.32123 type:complete len:529 (-) Transcript_16061:71-1657(-)